MLLAVEQLAPRVPIGAAAVLQAWLEMVREEMVTVDPLAQPVADAISVATNSSRSVWWSRA